MPGTSASRVVFFGTYDSRQHPRIAVMIDGLRARGVEVVEVNEPVWRSTEEKIRAARSSTGIVDTLLRTLRAWPRLARGLRAAGRYDAVVVGYLGQLDVLLARWLVRRRVPVVLDLFVSLYDTAVEDRRLIRPGSWKARALRTADSAAYRAADVVLFDTAAQRDHFVATFGVDASKARVVPVGAETFFAPRPTRVSDDAMRVLFFGLYTPLQGTTTIAEAARALAGERIEITMVGDGQDRREAERIAGELPHVRFLSRVEYEKLPDAIADHDVVLGVFGPAKGLRVVPNKVFQAAAVGRAIVTARCEPVDEAFGDTLVQVPAEDPRALAEALLALRDDPERRRALAEEVAECFHARFSIEAIGRTLAEVLMSGDRRSQMVATGDSERWSPGPRGLLRRDLVLRLLPAGRGRSALEVGCGAGMMLEELARRGFTVTGLDASEDAVVASTARVSPFAGAAVVRGELDAPEIASRGPFDLCCAFEVLEHIEDDEGALRAIREHLKPGGMLIASVPSKPERFGPYDVAVGHVRRYTRDDLIGKVEKAGFTVETFWCYGFPLATALETFKNRGAKDIRNLSFQERNLKSGVRSDVPSALRALMRPSVMAPFALLQRPFLKTDLGNGYVVLARVASAYL